MSPGYTKRLDSLGHTLNRWEAQVLGAWVLAATLGWLAVLSLIDVLVQLSLVGRTVSAMGVLLLVGFAAWRIGRTLTRAHSWEGVAARVERSFPELDNHLINHLQFSVAHDNNPFKLAYLKQGEPKWQGLDFRQMRDLKAQRRSLGTLAGVLVFIGILWLSLGPAWGVAVWRMLNPFSSVTPITLTTLLNVTPGNTTVLQGEPLIIGSTVQGFPGHSVKVELNPDDGDRKMVVLGSIDTSTEQRFSHRLARVNAGVQYRIHAGDAPASDWFTVATRPPPAFTDIAMTVNPPPYTGKKPTRVDALNEEALMHQGATVTLYIQCNTPLTSAEILPAEGKALPMQRGKRDTAWRGFVDILSGHSFTVRAVDVHGTTFEEQVAYHLVPDRAPVLNVTSPRGRIQLPAGQSPRIEFSVTDDYGLVSAEVQEVSQVGDKDTDGAILRTWPLDNVSSHAAVWTRDTALRAGGDVTYRVVVKDNCPFTDQRVRSLPLIFGTTSHSEAAKERKNLEKKASAGIQQIVELQRANVERTKTYLKAVDRATADHWKETSDRQQAIRTLTREMLGNPVQPFGGLTRTVKKLYLEEMSSAIRLLKEMPDRPEEKKAAGAKQALQVQEAILKQLGFAKTEATSSAAERRVSALSAMLESMIREQGNVMKKTKIFLKNGAKVGLSLVDAQDILPEDLTAFKSACVEEANSVRGNDEAFAATLDSIVVQCDSLNIRNHMVLAAERLDQNLPADALPYEEKSIQALQALQEVMGDVALKQEDEKRTVLAKALQNAKEKLERVRDLRARMLESMDAIRGQEDQSEGTVEAFEEAYEELVRNTRESLLEIPTDLHTFADMLAANDLVEDVFEVFQEIEQAEGTETGEQETELKDYAKEDKNLEFMDEAMERLDDIENWLLEKPDDKRVTAEAFDREEMPEDGTAKGELAEAVDDLISDLLEEDEQQEEDSDDSASTHGMSDAEIGWGVEEGETVTFSAKGKSGNRTPDHKEQDGRSIVGRQGMAVGETAAASGTINEGDNNIEERRTEDPTQDGKIDLAGEADTKATGGGKKGSGKADEFGMTGGVKRIDSSEQGSWEGMAALMAKQTDALYAKASLKNIRVDSLKQATHHLRQAEDAVANGNIEQMKEFRQMAAVSLQQARAQLEAGPSGAIDTGSGSDILDDVVEGGSDMAPADYRDQVADYYRALNEIL